MARMAAVNLNACIGTPAAVFFQPLWPVQLVMGKKLVAQPLRPIFHIRVANKW